MILEKNNNGKLNLFYLLEAILGAIMPVCIMLDKDDLSSLLFNASFIVVGMHFAWHLASGKMGKKAIPDFLLYLSMVVLAFAFVAISTESGFTFNYIKKFIIFCIVFLLFYIYSQEKINKETAKAVTFVFYAATIFFIVFFFFMGGNEKTNGELHSRYITMGFNNPNLAGMWLGTMIYFLAISVGMAKNKFFKIFTVMLMAVMLYMITVTECRNALLSLAVVLLLWIMHKIRKNKSFKPWSILFVIVLPLIFVGLYFAVLKTDLVDALEFLVSEGKNLDSRVRIWGNGLKTIDGIKLITGNYYAEGNKTGEFQLHNISLDILVAYGVIVFILSVLYITKLLVPAAKKTPKNVLNFGILCFFGVWLFGLGEAAFITGGGGIYLPSCLLFSMAYYTENLR